MSSRTVVGCALVLFVLAGCRSGSNSRAGARTSTTPTPSRFARIENTLRLGLERAHAQDAAGVRALRNPVSNEGLALLKARIPHDIRRIDVPRYLSARVYFGEALKQFVSAIDGSDDQAVFTAVRALYDATRGWISAYQGLPTETAV